MRRIRNATQTARLGVMSDRAQRAHDILLHRARPFPVSCYCATNSDGRYAHVRARRQGERTSRHQEARLRRFGRLVGETHAAGTSPVAIRHAVQRDWYSTTTILTRIRRLPVPRTTFCDVNRCPEMDETLAGFALARLRAAGGEGRLNTRVNGASADQVRIKDGAPLPTRTRV